MTIAKTRTAGVLRERHGAEIDRVLARYAQKKSATLPLLYLAQDTYGHLTEAAIYEVAEILGLPPTEVFEVVGFYTLFYSRPLGQWVLQVCDDVPCCFCGAEELIAALSETLGIHEGQTTPDGLFYLERVKCLAACDQAPVLQANLDFHYRVTPDRVDTLLHTLREWAAEGRLSISGRFAEDYQIVDGVVQRIARPAQNVPDGVPSAPEPVKAEAAGSTEETDSTEGQAQSEEAEEAARQAAEAKAEAEAPTEPSPDRSPAGVRPDPEKQDEGVVPANRPPAEPRPPTTGTEPEAS